jgi:CheY-like chemotaxis protein
MELRPRRHPRIRPLVLIVEGHEDARALYALALSANGFDVVAVNDGEDAYTRACELHPDIIVTDLPMPNEDGWKFVQSLKRDLRTRDIPVVAGSSHIRRSLCERAERGGFAAVFAKACLPHELAAGLRQVLGSRCDDRELVRGC